MQTIFPSDSEGTKWQKLGANIKEAVTASSTAVPADLTPINSCDSEGTKWYKLGRWLSLISGGPHLTGPAGPAGPAGADGADGLAPVIGMSGDQITIDGVITGPHLTGPAGEDGADGGTGTGTGGSKTPTALTADKDLENSDAGKYFYGTDKTITIPGSLGGVGIVDGRFTNAVLDWVTAGLGALGYWLPRGGGAVTSGIGAAATVTGGTLFSTAYPASFYNADGSPGVFNMSYINSYSPYLVFTFTLAGPTQLRVGLHQLGTDRIINLSDGCALSANADTAEWNFATTPAFWNLYMPAGTYELAFSSDSDNPGIAGMWWDTTDPENIPPAAADGGPFGIGDECEIFQIGANPIKIDPGINTVVSKGGLFTAGLGSLVRIKKIANNLYTLSGDTAVS